MAKKNSKGFVLVPTEWFFGFIFTGDCFSSKKSINVEIRFLETKNFHISIKAIDFESTRNINLKYPSILIQFLATSPGKRLRSSDM